jgi:hypothetical protein
MRMTTITFSPTTQNFPLDWGDSSIWSPAVVPNGADVDVVVPTIYLGQNPVNYEIDVGTGENYNIRSLDLVGAFLGVGGALSVSGDLDALGEIDMGGGTLSAGSLEVQGYDVQGVGVVNVAGALTIDTKIVGASSSPLTINAASLTDKGTLIASQGTLTVAINSGGFTNLAAGVLKGGTYQAENSGTLLMNVGQVVTVDAATIDLEVGGQIEFFDPATQQYDTIQATLAKIVKRGVLKIGADISTQFGNLRDDGEILLKRSANFAPTNLTIGPGGVLEGSGTVNSAVVNNGVIDANTSGSQHTSHLVVNAPVKGQGHFEIDGYEFQSIRPYEEIFRGSTLKLAGPQSEDVVFANGVGTLKLDNPKEFTGNIVATSFLAGAGPYNPLTNSAPEVFSTFTLALGGIAYNSVTGYSYSGDALGGVLTIDTTKRDYSFSFVGNFETADFTLSAEPPTLSTLPPTLDVTVSPTPVAPGVVHPNDLALSGDVTGPYDFIDMLNFVASYGDLITAFGTNQQAAQNWFNTSEPTEQRVETFDGLDYVASYADLINAFKSAGSEHAVLDAGATHFINSGYNEGRSTTFNGLDYIASYGDLISAFGVNGDAGAYHYIEHGAAEGRTTTFDGLDYIASYSDLIKALGANEQAGAANFIDFGYQEGRTTTFDGLAYIARYTDLMNAFGANNDAGATHYIDQGYFEGRSTSFNVAAYESRHPDLIGKYASNDAFLTAYIDTYKATGKFLK